MIRIRAAALSIFTSVCSSWWSEPVKFMRSSHGSWISWKVLELKNKQLENNEMWNVKMKWNVEWNVVWNLECKNGLECGLDVGWENGMASNCPTARFGKQATKSWFFHLAFFSRFLFLFLLLLAVISSCVWYKGFWYSVETSKDANWTKRKGWSAERNCFEWFFWDFIYLFIYLFRFANKLHVYENNKSKFTHTHTHTHTDERKKNPVWQGHHNSFRRLLWAGGGIQSSQLRKLMSDQSCWGIFVKICPFHGKWKLEKAVTS